MESVGGPERCAVLLHLLSLFAGCGSERRERYTEQSDGSQAEKAGERHRDTQRERARGLFCCERSESPAGGAALTICQWSHALFFLFFPPSKSAVFAPRRQLQQIKKAARQKLYSDTQPADTPDLPSMPLAFSASSSFSLQQV